MTVPSVTMMTSTVFRGIACEGHTDTPKDTVSVLYVKVCVGNKRKKHVCSERYNCSMNPIPDKVKTEVVFIFVLLAYSPVNRSGSPQGFHSSDFFIVG